MKNISIRFWAFFTACSVSCQSYLDIVPDDIPTIENAFTMRVSAERFLFTCYSYMPLHSSLTGNPGFTAGDEFWLHNNYTTPGWEIARGGQNVVNPYLNFWQGTEGAKDLYQGIRDCNIFLENVGNVPDLPEFERNRWIAEVKFLKAYYHFWLVQMYGPIPIKRENLPVFAGIDEVKVKRDPVDECFAYIVQLLDEASLPNHLPDRIQDEASELGRITRLIALSFKAQVLATAASPFFNGNADYNNFVDHDGVQLFNPTFDPQKWVLAETACRDAIALAETTGRRLYYYNQSALQYDIPDSLRIQMNIRNAVTQRWNDEIIWGNTNSRAVAIQSQAHARGLDPAMVASARAAGNLAVPLKIVETFYTHNGVPINEDHTWNYANRYTLRSGGSADRYYIREGYTTAALNFDREPRFYASLGFDGGIWYGQGRYTRDQAFFYVQAKQGQPSSTKSNATHNVTGYWPKKLVYYTNEVTTITNYSQTNYAWPVIRLADLYLLYAEVLNEVHGAIPECYYWLDLVRERAGLDGVVESWANFSTHPDKPLSQEGLRDIIRRERLIELAFEGIRYWDLRRWKMAVTEFNQPITGWDISQRTTEGYYRVNHIFNRQFSHRDYLWPIRENELLANKNTVQNPGW
ncbi:Starch-binding associating with outer membrane [Parapedobacter composti]|uniref:Starch-binding associating with outer membrane n=1 Tax=Parapedobacter composti TaxID=623281 RepID=A0A1I1EVB9_9SPHI|nr:RagB/SusD family nutrient uptake outer membrane protein [Parapedobacter composti]SFB90632.1 Starch-binding associating with outer membrane [Parapedobacter composti]